MKDEQKQYFQTNKGRYPDEIVFGEKLFVKRQDLRYGENPHQTSAFYALKDIKGTCISNSELVRKGEKELSLINILDANAALNILQDLYKKDEGVAVAIKHSTPCSVAFSYKDDMTEALGRAIESDPESIFGCVLGLSGSVDLEVAQKIIDEKLYMEAIIATGYTESGLRLLEKAGKNIRAIRVGSLEARVEGELEIITVDGGILLQEPYRTKIVSRENLEVLTKRAPTDDEYDALLRMWKVVGRVKSNAIVIGDRYQTHGVAGGHTSRISAARHAVDNSVHVYKKGKGHGMKGCVLASDAFFPFPDVVELAADNGISAIVFPLGSKNDEKSIEVMDDYGITGVTTRPIPGTKEIERAFYGHK
jgi:phosphoribosylaminoimidazolecarboxamide formyltransferase / IMP cyclohydrolase